VAIYGRAEVALVWWLLAAFGGIGLARKRRGGRILLTVLMVLACSLLAAVWLGGQMMLPALFALFLIDVVKATFRLWPRKPRSASS
jgi:asparagine N-glycosylation enzyme membrane subunit Stt3